MMAILADTNIPFEIVYANIGSGWSSMCDAFQAPVDGVYQFYASMRSEASGSYAYHTRVVSLYGSSGSDMEWRCHLGDH